MSYDVATAYWRFGLGARPGDLASGADGRALLLAELTDPKIALLDGERLLDTPAALAAYRAYRQYRRNEQRAAAQQPADDAGDAMPAELQAKKGGKGTRDRGERPRNYTLRSELPVRLARISEASPGFVERLVMFWANHFAIEADNSPLLRAVAGAYEREAIRPHVLGRFEGLLFAATRHPAMLTYLNNAASVGADSTAGQRREAGLNENHARELMELHTLGVDGGYSQADVTSLANILTGWSVARGARGEDFGQFRFLARAHQPGTQTLLGQAFDQRGVRQGEVALRMLASHPATATHVATRLVRYFVADDPPADLVSRLAAVFTDTDGDLAAVSRALVEDEAAWTAPPAKLRSPQEYVFAAMRALGVTPRPPELVQALATLGQPLFDPPSPAGYPEDARPWLAPDAMTNRLDIAEILAASAGDVDPRTVAEDVLGPRLSELTAQTIARAESPAQGLALMLMSPEFQRR